MYLCVLLIPGKRSPILPMQIRKRRNSKVCISGNLLWIPQNLVQDVFLQNQSMRKIHPQNIFIGNLFQNTNRISGPRISLNFFSHKVLFVIAFSLAISIKSLMLFRHFYQMLSLMHPYVIHLLRLNQNKFYTIEPKSAPDILCQMSCISTRGKQKPVGN